MKNIADVGFSNSFWEGLRNFFLVLANISLALAFFNLLPLPALDGGYIVMSVVEMVMRKPVKMRYVYVLNFAALMLLMSLGLLVAVMDIFTLWDIKNLIREKVCEKMNFFSFFYYIVNIIFLDGGYR